ncbi:MAG: hypothetical protein MHM6MM_008934 [Cercozoa sp. M6MM]
MVELSGETLETARTCSILLELPLVVSVQHPTVASDWAKRRLADQLDTIVHLPYCSHFTLLPHLPSFAI